MLIKHLTIYHLVLFTCVVNSLKDFRYISYQDLQLSLDKFAEDGVTTYSQLLFDTARNQVFVGARDVLYRLSLARVQLLESAAWTSPRNATKLCVDKGQSERNCHNYIKVLLRDGDRLFVCGTNSFRPMCNWREMGNISHVLDTVDGRARCPYDPHANVTARIVRDGDGDDGGYYIGGPTDFSGSDFAIYRSVGKQNLIRTKQYDSLWLNEPQFVGSFERGAHVYFLFREPAVEYMNCGKIVYSRIARLCKRDAGGPLMFKDNWSTFVKARLVCAIDGDYPFHFDEIQGVHYASDGGGDLLYATFTTPTNGIGGSAICAFNMSAIEAAFAGPFKYQKHVGAPWETHANTYRDHFGCKEEEGGGGASSSRGNKHFDTFKYQLMETHVRATTADRPLYVAQLERFVHVSVDVVATKLHAAVHVIYVSTVDGLVKKLSVLPRTRETCVVEIWEVTVDARAPIVAVRHVKETNSVYVGTEGELLRVPAHHCRRHVSRESCVNAMDPYCGWNELEDACTIAPNGNALEKYWHQLVTACPVLNAPVDGGWSSWSQWSACLHRSNADASATDACLCQTRQCDNPAAKHGGRACAGASIAVTNCTLHGGWTAWSAWSECSATCGIAVKTRTRTCTNPAPAHGGRVCVGQDRSEALCTGNPPCPVTKAAAAATAPRPRDGRWGAWRPWEPCSAPCGTGFRRRVRRCDDPAPYAGGADCTGADVEYETCNAYPCAEQVKHAWSQWFVAYDNANRLVRKRFKYTCRAAVRDATQLTIGYKEQERACGSADNCAAAAAATDGGGAAPKWTDWSECSVSCGGGGYQERRRVCEKRNGKCQGRETRKCNEDRPCRSEWGCWSDWSPCSVTCGWGIRKRYRPCVAGTCKGDNLEEEPCEVQSCGSLLGWEPWSEWSICDEERHEQRRKRNCRSKNPGPTMCQGPSVETRICKGDRWPDGMMHASSSVGLIVGCLSLGFCACFVLSLAAWFYYNRRRSRPRIPSSPHYMSAKQNPYMAVPFQERSPPLPTSGKKQCAHTSSNAILLNNVHGNNGTSKAAKYDYDSIKRNSHGLNNGHATKADLLIGDDKLYYG